MHVALRRVEVLVAEQLLNLAQIGALPTARRQQAVRGSERLNAALDRCDEIGSGFGAGQPQDRQHNGQHVLGTVVDLAGNSATASYSAQIDKVAPTISASPTVAANANGWNNTDVTVRFNADKGLPNPETTTVALIQSAEAPDPFTFVVYFKEPYYQGNQLGIRNFWPQPKHLLGDAYDKYVASGNPEEVINLPYWTSQYLHTGPYRLTSFDPAGDIVFEAFDRYFLGKPKIDVVRVRVFLDEKVLFASLQIFAVWWALSLLMAAFRAMVLLLTPHRSIR